MNPVKQQDWNNSNLARRSWDKRVEKKSDSRTQQTLK